MSKEKKSSTPKSKHPVADNKNIIGNVQQFLTNREIALSQCVNKEWFRSGDQKITLRTSKEISDSKISKEEKKNIWIIMKSLRDDKRYYVTPPVTPPKPKDHYSSLRNKHLLSELTRLEINLLQKENLLTAEFSQTTHGHLPLPNLPDPPRDPFVTSRTKDYLHELTIEEIYQLFSHGLLDESFLALAKSDPKKLHSLWKVHF